MEQDLCINNTNVRILADIKVGKKWEELEEAA